MGYPRILCPQHKEDTPSCVLYPDGVYHCFGCGAHGLSKDLKGLEDGTVTAKVEQADLEAELKRIHSLPVQSVRGISLHTDSSYYYVVWPNRGYYKKRAIAERQGFPKYQCPAGHPKPIWYTQPILGSKVLIVVEGEINALSIQAACPQYSIWCPGGTGDFYSRSAPARLQDISFRNYVQCLVLTDRDSAGAIACIKFKALAAGLGPQIDCFLMPKDANEILQETGTTGLRKEIERYLGLSQRMQTGQGPV